jgi:hypothetical protein
MTFSLEGLTNLQWLLSWPALATCHPSQTSQFAAAAAAVGDVETCRQHHQVAQMH